MMDEKKYRDQVVCCHNPEHGFALVSDSPPTGTSPPNPPYPNVRVCLELPLQREGLDQRRMYLDTGREERVPHHT